MVPQELRCSGRGGLAVASVSQSFDVLEGQGNSYLLHTKSGILQTTKSIVSGKIGRPQNRSGSAVLDKRRELVLAEEKK